MEVSHTERVAVLIALRFDGPLYTANVRSANRKVLETVDASPGVDVVVLDALAQAILPVTVIDEMADLDHELTARGVTLWISGLPPRVLATAKLTPRELERVWRLFPTTLVAVKGNRDR